MSGWPVALVGMVPVLPKRVHTRERGRPVALVGMVSALTMRVFVRE